MELTPQGYLIAKFPGTPGLEDRPTVALFAHVDTSRDFDGDNVQPIVYRNYSGEAILFPKDPALVLDPEAFPTLKEKVGDTIVTASGDTLLGADDKSAVAILVTLAERLIGGHSGGL
jgi:tripeptide aminopeptidase